MVCGVLGSLPENCDKLNHLEQELGQLDSIHKTYADLSSKGFHDIRTVQVRIDALKSAIALVPRHTLGANTNSFREVSEWMAMTLEETMNRDLNEIAPAVANFVNAQDDDMAPLLGDVLFQLIAREERQLSYLATVVNHHQQVAQRYSLKIESLTSDRDELLALCLLEVGVL